MMEEHVQLMGEELVQGQDVGQEAERQEEDDALLASRLDGEAPALKAQSAVDEAQSEAEANEKEDKAKRQKQEANALLDDLFGDQPVGESNKAEETEDGTLAKSESL